MKSETCRALRLAEYVDGELSGVERLLVSRHLEHCRECDEEAASMQRLGDTLRSAAKLTPVPMNLSGLAGGVISRVGAERAQSWKALFGRAVEDWHWFMVGFGSVAASFFSVALVSAVLHFGPAPEREDSVSALLSNRDWQVLNSAQGSLYVWASPIRASEWRIALTSRERMEATQSDPEAVANLTEQDMVNALSDTLVRPGGLQTMTPAMRSLAGALFKKINDLQAPTLNVGGDARGPVYRLQFVTNTEVTPKGF
jgi:hypothetical protein